MAGVIPKKLDDFGVMAVLSPIDRGSLVALIADIEWGSAAEQEVGDFEMAGSGGPVEGGVKGHGVVEEELDDGEVAVFA